MAKDELRLSDGRQVEIDRVEISHAMAGFLVGLPERIWEMVLPECVWAMDCNRDGRPPAYVVTPLSANPRRKWLPEWRVDVVLTSEPMKDPHADRSSMVVVFFCGDLSSRLGRRATQ